MSNAEVIPTYSQIYRKGRGYFPLVLEVRHIESTPVLVAAPGSDIVHFRKGSRYQAIVIGESQIIVRSLTLIEPNAADFHAGLESMTPMRPRKIVDKAEGGANFDVLRVVIDSREARQVHRVGEGARLGIVEGGPVDVDLRFIEYVCVENVLQRNKVICRVIEDMLKKRTTL